MHIVQVHATFDVNSIVSNCVHNELCAWRGDVMSHRRGRNWHKSNSKWCHVHRTMWSWLNTELQLQQGNAVLIDEHLILVCAEFGIQEMPRKQSNICCPPFEMQNAQRTHERYVQFPAKTNLYQTQIIGNVYTSRGVPMFPTDSNHMSRSVGIWSRSNDKLLLNWCERINSEPICTSMDRRRRQQQQQRIECTTLLALSGIV